MERSQASAIQNDLQKKIVLVSGPRQCGKTTLAQMLPGAKEYMNYDYAEHRDILREKSWDRRKSLLVFDEIHKMPDWKRYLKGIYDAEGIPPGILVMGSARLDLIRRTGDSLAGRFFQHRLHPFDVKEARNEIEPEEAFKRISRFGGFPEPFLANDAGFYNRWRRSHIDIILRQDMLDLESVRDIKSVEVLIDLLRSRVGSPISYASLARDLQKDAKTVKRWLEILESLYIIFPVRPYHRNVARSILKEPKYYFYDSAQVRGQIGARLENIVACALLKECHTQTDTYGRDVELGYVRSKDGREIDFVIVEDQWVRMMIETRSGGGFLSPHFSHFDRFFPDTKRLQVVHDLTREKTFPDGAEMRSVVPWLAELSL